MTKTYQLLLSHYNDDEKIKTNVISFNTVILAFANRGASKEARNLLNQMRNSTFEGVKPDIIKYSSVLYAHAIAQEPYEAEELLKDMIASLSMSTKFDKDYNSSTNKRTI